MPRTSAGLLPWRRRADGGGLEVFVARMGGPFWQGREAGAWSIVKGELAEGEEPLAAALREFGEETGLAVAGPFVPLTPVRQAAGKLVIAYAVEAPNLDPAQVRSNTFPVEWPRGSGRFRRYPEIERAAWLAPAEARGLIVKGQVALLDELEARLPGGDADPAEEQRP